jgi:hypothetical protein
MLVNLEPYGRLGNRLFLGAHLMAFSMRYELSLLNLGFGEYVSWYPWFEGNAGFAFPWRPTGDLSAADRLRSQYRLREFLPWTHRFRYWGDHDLDFDRTELPQLLTPLRRGRDVLFRAWLFRGYESLSRFKPQVLEVFRPQVAVSDAVAQFVAAARKGADVLVGVHVRWEDYRGTENFLDQEAFRQRLEDFRSSRPGVRVRFALFSNEVLSQEGWGDLDIVLSPGTTPLFDLTAMSLCDHLMGPPSTFSGWASFAGNVPLEVLRASATEKQPRSLNG